MWSAVKHYWDARVQKGFTQSSRAKKAEKLAGEFLSSDHAAFSRDDVDFRAQDHGVDGRAEFMGRWLPSQVKHFRVKMNVVQSYVEHEPAYQKGGCIVSTGFDSAAVEYIKGMVDTHHISLVSMARKDILSNTSETRTILKWLKK